MSGRVAFEKWEGLGNDFVLVEDDASAWSDEAVKSVCDRRRGVGGDGILFVDRGDADRLPRMVVRNADGSRPEMCGNGIRCVAGYLVTRTFGAAPAHAVSHNAGQSIAIATDAGTKLCEVSRREASNGAEVSFDVAVQMGPALLEGTWTVEIEGRAHTFVRGNVGNPHAITFEPYDQGEIDHIGPLVSTFPQGGTNVEFCRLVRGVGEEAGAFAEVPRVDVVVWERGVGLTQACGTGACAVASAACSAGYFERGAPVRVRLPGGDLLITIGKDAPNATMVGPARRSFSGELTKPGRS